LAEAILRLPNPNHPHDLTIREQFIGEYRGVTFLLRKIEERKSELKEALEILSKANIK
jgi:hypothetical protein